MANYQLTQPAGTQVVIFASSEGGKLQYSSGGSSQIQTLGEGSDTSCVEQLEASPTDRSAPSSTGGSGSDDGGLSAGATAGAAVGSIVGAGALIAAIVAFVLLKKKKNDEQHEHAQKVKHGQGYNEDVDDGLDGSYTPYIMTGRQGGAGHSHRHSDSRYSSVPTDGQGLTASESGHGYTGVPPSPSSGGLLLGAGATSRSQHTHDSKSRHGYHVSNSTNTKEQPRYHVDAGPYVVNNQQHDDGDDALVDVPPAYNFNHDRQGGV